MKELKWALAVSLCIAAAGCSTQKVSSSQTQDSPGTSQPKIYGRDADTMAMASIKRVPGFVKNGVFVNKAGKPMCPVTCGAIDDPKTAKFQVYKGVKYYFCCPSCPGEFQSNPEKYAKYSKSKV